MKIKSIKPPREFQAGRLNPVKLKDCARIRLSANEQVTFVTPSGSEYDVTRKDWGFYATPSINNRLKKQGFRVALVRNLQGKLFILLIDRKRLQSFTRYRRSEQLTVMEWLGEKK